MRKSIWSIFRIPTSPISVCPPKPNGNWPPKEHPHPKELRDSVVLIAQSPMEMDCMACWVTFGNGHPHPNPKETNAISSSRVVTTKNGQKAYPRKQGLP